MLLILLTNSKRQTKVLSFSKKPKKYLTYKNEKFKSIDPFWEICVNNSVDKNLMRD